MSSQILSIENQFTHATFCLQIEQMSLEQARQIACLLHEQLLVQRESYQQIMAAKWGLGDCRRL